MHAACTDIERASCLGAQGLEELRQDPPRRGPVPEGLDWEPLDLTAQGSDIAGLLGRCDWIDRGVPAIAHMHGGSGEGYARWEAFRCKGLDLYAAHRNNALKRHVRPLLLDSLLCLT